MAIPKNINVEHVVKAIDIIDRQGVAENRESTKYVIVFNDKHFPPKYVISIANKFANGTELSASDFSGGDETNKFLKSLGFMIQLDIKDNTKESLEDRFNKDVIEAYKTAKSIGYNASVFIQLVSRDGALKVAKDFIHKNQATTGFEKLWEKGRLDLTIEAQTILPIYKTLFTFEERMAAYERLKSYNYEVQGVIFEDGVDLQTIQEDILAENIEDGYELRSEGGIKTFFGKRYERNAENRLRAIEIHGLSCVVCNFNFEEAYGERGKDFVEVHHVNPLSTLDGIEVEVDPATDLAPVCANCHRMIHRRHGDVLTIEQMKAIVK
jgi:5-methylcytosine-specific restriction enzyme A